jgi:GTP cyclohydrolase IA
MQEVPTNKIECTDAQANQHKISWHELVTNCNRLIQEHDLSNKKVYGVPRGGAVIVGLCFALDSTITIVNDPSKASYIIDDLIDTGATREQFKHHQAQFITLYDKTVSKAIRDSWLIFPYEEVLDRERESHVERLLETYGYNLTGSGLKETPKRFIKAWNELLIAEEPRLTIFDANGYNQMIVDKDIPFYSLCEHHILPFFGTVKVGYIPNDSIIGLSKIARVVDYFSHRLNTQEYLADNIANYIQNKLNPKGVAVVIKARHLCKEMRGAKQKGEMVTASLRGCFMDDNKTREEFYAI